MGKPTGFLEYARELPTELTPSDRLRNWDEFHLPMPDEKLQTQGARCMDCGTPFCIPEPSLAAWPVVVLLTI